MADKWRDKLTDEQYRILRQGGTEPPFTGKYVSHKEDGMYACAACGMELFHSGTKFDSGSGWPSFSEPMNREHVKLLEDRSHGMVRTEIRCAGCDGHLGHVFDDGPPEMGGQRYCVNSCALDFKKED